MKKVVANLTQNGLSDIQVNDLIFEFGENSRSHRLAPRGWVVTELKTMRI